MTSTAPCNRPRAMRPERNTPLSALILLALLLAPLTAQALRSDRDQPMLVNAKNAEKAPGIAHLNGDVVLRQGSLHGSGAHGIIYTDAKGKVTRVVLEGSPARLSQQMDGGGEMHGAALTIDYTPASGTAVLIGDANVDQSGHGSFSGAKLVYNTRTGAMQGEGGRGQVQLIFQPRRKSAPAAPASSKPAHAGSGGGKP